METLNLQVPVEGGALAAFFDCPQQATALVLFVHGGGSSRFSRRTRWVAQVLNRGRLATLRFDLLTAEECERDRQTRELRFHIPLLTSRVVDALDWARGHPAAAALPVGLFGASTGAAAALGAAAARPEQVRALVCRGGRTDLAAEVLPRVRVPTLLIAGSLDREVVRMNREAARIMPAEPRLEVIQGASHLFEEAGKLDLVAYLSRDWLSEQLAGPPSPPP